MGKRIAVRFDDQNPIRYEFFLDEDDRATILIAKFSGTYRIGSSGAPDARFVSGMINAALEVWDWAQDGLVIDFSALAYEWGDEMDYFMGSAWVRWYGPHIPSATVVGPKCERGIATLLFGEDTRQPATDQEWILDDLEAAVTYVRGRAKSAG